MDKIGTFLHTNLLGIVVGAVVALILAWLVRLAIRLLKFARAYGVRQLLNTGKDAFLHIAAYPTIKADPVLTMSYLGNHLASAVANAMLCILCAIFVASDAGGPWVHALLALGALFFAYRVFKQWLVVVAFYSTTAGAAIENVKRTNPVLKNWYGIKDKKPFFQFGKSETPQGDPQTIDVSPSPSPAAASGSTLTLPGAKDATSTEEQRSDASETHKT